MAIQIDYARPGITQPSLRRVDHTVWALATLQIVCWLLLLPQNPNRPVYGTEHFTVIAFAWYLDQDFLTIAVWGIITSIVVFFAATRPPEKRIVWYSVYPVMILLFWILQAAVDAYLTSVLGCRLNSDYDPQDFGMSIIWTNAVPILMAARAVSPGVRVVGGRKIQRE